MNWYRKSAEQNDASAQRNLGWMYLHGRGIPQSDLEAIKWYRKSAEQNNARAQFALGWIYKNGRGVVQSDLEAVKWYRKSAEQNNIHAQHGLGEMYQQGRGVSQSYTEALTWYKKSAKQNPLSAFALGVFFDEAWVVKEDKIMAYCLQSMGINQITKNADLPQSFKTECYERFDRLGQKLSTADIRKATILRATFKSDESLMDNLLNSLVELS